MRKPRYAARNLRIYLFEKNTWVVLGQDGSLATKSCAPSAATESRKKCPRVVSTIFRYSMTNRKFRRRREPFSPFIFVIHARAELAADHDSSQYFELKSAAKERCCCICTESKLKPNVEKSLYLFEIQSQVLTCNYIRNNPDQQVWVTQ